MHVGFNGLHEPPIMHATWCVKLAAAASCPPVKQSPFMLPFGLTNLSPVPSHIIADLSSIAPRLYWHYRLYLLLHLAQDIQPTGIEQQLSRRTQRASRDPLSLSPSRTALSGITARGLYAE